MKNLGKDVKAEVTDMDQPLGMAVGNSLEIKEVIDIHVGDRTRGSADFGFYKKRIFEHFFTEPQIQEVEYTI